MGGKEKEKEKGKETEKKREKETEKTEKKEKEGKAVHSCENRRAALPCRCVHPAWSYERFSLGFSAMSLCRHLA